MPVLVLVRRESVDTLISSEACTDQMVHGTRDFRLGWVASGVIIGLTIADLPDIRNMGDAATWRAAKSVRSAIELGWGRRREPLL